MKEEEEDPHLETGYLAIQTFRKPATKQPKSWKVIYRLIK
jgi:hypothetical protein